MTDYLAAILPAGVIIGGTILLVISLLCEPKCPKCKSVLKRGGYYGEKMFCPNVKCRKYLVESYD